MLHLNENFFKMLQNHFKEIVMQNVLLYTVKFHQIEHHI